MPVDPQALYARGLISDDAMSSFADRLAAYGAPPSENVEDRRGESLFPAWLRTIDPGMTASFMRDFPWLYREWFPQKIPRQAGQLREQAGYYDINKRQTP